MYDLSNPDEPKKVTEHKDIEDEGQTITFKEKPEEPEKPETPPTPEKPNRPSDSPKTGDNTNLYGLLALLLTSANGISVTLTCVLLALFDWRLALCVFITLPIAFLVIWCSRKYQIKLFEKQVETKLNASSQVQEYLEGIKIIKSCNLSGVHFRTLNRALLEMKKIAVKVEMVVGIFMSSASMILQAGIGITIFVGTILLVNGQIELLPLLMFFLIVSTYQNDVGL